MTPVINGLELGQEAPPATSTEVVVTPTEEHVVIPTSESVLAATIEPTPVTAPTPTGVPVNNSPLNIERPADFSPLNFHVLFVGVGFDPDEIPGEMDRLMSSRIRQNFQGLAVDFAYVKEPVHLNFQHLGTIILFTNDQERIDLLSLVRSQYPADSVVIAVKMNEMVGTSLNSGEVIIFSSNNLAVEYLTTHELGHQLGLGDAYEVGYFRPSEFPNSEMFYLDDMPDYLVKALNKLGTMPPMYEAGTCNGRKLYTFYDNYFNLMGLYVFDGPRPWGDTAFTPLQLIIMKNRIAELKGE